MAGKIKKLMPRVVFQRLSNLYTRMEDAYRVTAEQTGFTCMDCPDNCCSSFFRHHTRVEWAYFIKGLDQAPQPQRQRIFDRAEDYMAQARTALAQGRTPEIMCPVNENGLCTLYSYRLMICRLHGVPTFHSRPDGRILEFPGCFRSQEKTAGMKDYPKLDRTGFYQELAALEQAFTGPRIARLPRVNLTLAEMIVHGSPEFSGQQTG
ncbi:MAG: hypothetical protein ACLFT1_09495, partial [Desulfonatronovibrio sp.]